jgi:hypothetical protein
VAPQDRSGVICWWGAYTREWWAVIPGGTHWKIVNVPDPEALIEAVFKARGRR